MLMFKTDVYSDSWYWQIVIRQRHQVCISQAGQKVPSRQEPVSLFSTFNLSLPLPFSLAHAHTCTTHTQRHKLSNTQTPTEATKQPTKNLSKSRKRTKPSPTRSPGPHTTSTAMKASSKPNKAAADSTRTTIHSIFLAGSLAATGTLITDSSAATQSKSKLLFRCVISTRAATPSSTGTSSTFATSAMGPALPTRKSIVVRSAMAADGSCCADSWHRACTRRCRRRASGVPDAENTSKSRVGYARASAC